MVASLRATPSFWTKVVQSLHHAHESLLMDDIQTMNEVTASPLGLSTSQAARALGVSLGTIRRWSDMGYLDSYRTPGGQRRFSREQIEQFVTSLQQGVDTDRVRAAS
jgi:excisionase family DNA binding protein